MREASNCENWRKTSDELLVFLAHVLSRSPRVCVSVAVLVGEGGNNDRFEFLKAGCLFNVAHVTLSDIQQCLKSRTKFLFWCPLVSS